MIWYYIILFVTSLFTAVFDWLPTVTELPFGIDAALVTAVGYFNFVLAELWPLQILWTCTLWYYGLVVTLMILKLFLGHRIR